MTNFEMAHSDDPEEIIMATQRSLCKAMREVIAGLKKDTGVPGLTWEQIDYLIKGFEDKLPTIVLQKEEF